MRNSRLRRMLLDKYLKSPISEHPSTVNMLKSRILVKSAWQRCHHNNPSLWVKLTWKMSFLVICEIFGAFVNKLPVDDKHALRNCHCTDCE